MGPLVIGARECTLLVVILLLVEDVREATPELITVFIRSHGGILRDADVALAQVRLVFGRICGASSFAFASAFVTAFSHIDDHARGS